MLWAMTEAQCGMKPSQCMLPGSGTSESQGFVTKSKECGSNKNEAGGVYRTV